MSLDLDTQSLEMIFNLGSRLTLAGWVILILLPRRWAFINAIPALIIPSLVAIAYSALVFSGFGSSGGDFSSLDGVRKLFSSDTVLVAGWLHYLAFDLLVGTYIAGKADEIGLHRVLQVPILLLTFIFGPAGFLVFQLVRGGMGIAGSRR